MSSYTPEQMERRQNTKWTLVQAILAPLQFIAFVASIWLIVHYLRTGDHYQAATISVLVKILLMWLITITGMFWEKEVFGHWFLAPEFFWEDAVNGFALLAHNLYFVVMLAGWSEQNIMVLMLIAYSTYMINFAQFFVRGLQARKDRQQPEPVAIAPTAAGD